MTEKYAPAPSPSYRIIPSLYPPVGLFDTISTAADLEKTMALVGWTNDRRVESRVERLDRSEWVYGQPNASIVMAAFLHVPSTGMRFNSGALGAWYAAATVRTAMVAVAHHLRREATAQGIKQKARTFRTYSCSLAGSYLDIRGEAAIRPEVYDPESYLASQALGESVRDADRDGILYDSVRHTGGTNVVTHRPRNVSNIMQTDHYRISVEAGNQTIQVKRLS